jgi:putative transposase
MKSPENRKCFSSSGLTVLTGGHVEPRLVKTNLPLMLNGIRSTGWICDYIGTGRCLIEHSPKSAVSQAHVCGSGARERRDQRGPHPKALTPSAKREAARTMVEDVGLSVVRACSSVRLSRAAYYRPVEESTRDAGIVTALNEIIAVELRWGFWKCYERLRQLGQPWNHKRVHRVYCAMRLNQQRRTKRRLPTRERQSMIVVPIVNAVWALDFMFDSLYSGRPFRTLNVLDEANRGALGIEIATSIPALRVIRFLEQLIEIHGQPAAIRCDDGPELTSYAFTEWCKAKDINLMFIQPGKPDQNAFIERFNRTYRTEVLNAYLFESISQVREITDDWLRRYSEFDPTMRWEACRQRDTASDCSQWRIPR